MTTTSTQLRLGVEEVTAQFEPSQLLFETTDELPLLDAIFGQERATRAIEFALGMSAPGYNLYASGPDGIGKATIVGRFLRRRAAERPTPPDWVYVHNFSDPDRPVGISLPPGRGRPFALDIHRIVQSATEALRSTLESDGYARQRQELANGVETERGAILETLRAEAAAVGFALEITPQGIASQPTIDGRPLQPAELAALPGAQRDQLAADTQRLERTVQEAMLKLRSLERSAQARVERLGRDVVALAIGQLFDPLLEEHATNAEIVEYVRAIRRDLTEHGAGARSEVPPQVGDSAASDGIPRRYQVNAAICHQPDSGAPVVFEQHPTYRNLLGRIDYERQLGAAVSDHTLIKPGSLATANGGYIVLRMRDLLSNPPSLDGLKRALSSGRLAIENPADSSGAMLTPGLRPESIPLEVKVAIIGDAGLYSILYRLDPDFRELFRVKADFESELERNTENSRGLASYLRSQCDQIGIRCLDAGAVARLIEHSSRVVGHQQRLSANVSAILDLARQADYWADGEGDEVITSSHVERAIDEAVYRSALLRDRMQEMIHDGTIHVETDGARIGQINALSVSDLGDISAGRPSRVTCVASSGRGEIVMIERESQLAGKIHNKGFLILRGFLVGRFGQHAASTLHASLTFEQLYGDIDGDSASSTELYVLLSALAEVPVHQGIAVTGSVDQHGRIQPIGGVIEKIEGFHAVCSARGLDGTQGVIIPRANVSNVVLRGEVAQDIADGRFSVWAIETIEEGIELLTGTTAGERNPHGLYPDGSLFRQVTDRLATFADELRSEPGGHVSIASTHVYPGEGPPPPQPGIPPPLPPGPPVIV